MLRGEFDEVIHNTSCLGSSTSFEDFGDVVEGGGINCSGEGFV